MQRRKLLQLGVASTAVLAVLVVTGGAMAMLQPGLQHGQLSATSKIIFTSLGRAILDGTLPPEAAAQEQALTGLVGRIEVLVQGLPPHAQGELSQLLGLLGTGIGRRTLAGVASDWPDASVAEVQRGMQSMLESSLALRVQSYQALHDIVGSAYFSDASTWAKLNYPGPLDI